jgi:hypothetical protein
MQYGAGLSGKIYPARLHEGCLDEYLEIRAIREREHLEIVAYIAEAERRRANHIGAS